MSKSNPPSTSKKAGFAFDTLRDERSGFDRDWKRRGEKINELGVSSGSSVVPPSRKRSYPSVSKPPAAAPSVMQPPSASSKARTVTKDALPSTLTVDSDLQSATASLSLLSARSALGFGASDATVVTNSSSSTGRSGVSTLSGSSMSMSLSGASGALFGGGNTGGTSTVVSDITPEPMEQTVPKATGAPKSCLHATFGRSPRRKVISQDNYFTWHDGGPPHALKWTSVFVDPVTGELFPSGRYGSPQQFEVRDVMGGPERVVWYSKKTQAEHAAAARALDCISRRETPSSMPSPQFGLDSPYPDDKQMMLPSLMPYDLRTKADEAQDRIRRMDVDRPV